MLLAVQISPPLPGKHINDPVIRDPTYMAYTSLIRTGNNHYVSQVTDVSITHQYQYRVYTPFLASHINYIFWRKNNTKKLELQHKTGLICKIVFNNTKFLPLVSMCVQSMYSFRAWHPHPKPKTRTRPPAIVPLRSFRRI